VTLVSRLGIVTHKNCHTLPVFELAPRMADIRITEELGYNHLGVSQRLLSVCSGSTARSCGFVPVGRHSNLYQLAELGPKSQWGRPKPELSEIATGGLGQNVLGQQ